MTVAQIKLIKDAYMAEAKKPNGEASTIGAYMRIMLDGGMEFVTSKDLVTFDDANELLHAVCLNEDMKSQADYPVKIISSDYAMVQQIETIMSQKNFETFLVDGFLKDNNSTAKLEYMKTWTRRIRNQAQQPMEAEPYFDMKDDPKIIPMAATRIEKGTFVPNPAATVTKDDGTKVSYATIQEAIADLDSGVTLSLESDVNLGKDDIVEIKSGKTSTINLNGNNITSNNTGTLFNVSNGTLNIEGEGTIESTGEVFRAVSSDGAAASIVIGPDVNVESETDCCLFIRGEGASFTSEANLTSNGKYATVMGNGNGAGTVININGGTITCNDIAIYHPQDGEINISGDAIISGYTGVYMKAGTLNISDSVKVIGTGAKVEYNFNGNGADPTGDALVADFCNYPGGYPIINITGGEFISTYANGFEAYAKDDAKDAAVIPANVNISGGMFSSEVASDYLAEGAVCEFNTVTERYSVSA